MWCDGGCSSLIDFFIFPKIFKGRLVDNIDWQLHVLQRDVKNHQPDNVHGQETICMYCYLQSPEMVEYATASIMALQRKVGDEEAWALVQDLQGASENASIYLSKMVDEL